MPARGWPARQGESRVLGNVVLRSLGIFMLLCSIFSISRQFAAISKASTPRVMRNADGPSDLALFSHRFGQVDTPVVYSVVERMMEEPSPGLDAGDSGSGAATAGSSSRALSTPTPVPAKPVTEKPTAKPTEKPTDKPKPKDEKPKKKRKKLPRTPEPKQHIRKGTKGILLCLHDGVLDLGISLIRELRCLGNKEPIEVHHCHDLSKTSADLIEGLDDNVRIVDLCDRYVKGKVMKAKMAKTFQSYWIKPLAVHFTSFDELIFLDADDILLKDPALLRHNEGYKKRGTLFFYDRVVNSNQYFNKRKTNKQTKKLEGPTYLKRWLRAFDYERFGLKAKGPSRLLSDSFAFAGKTAHEQDSSMLLINKSKAGKALSVLWYLITEHRFGYEFSWGDKEAFWLAYEFSQTPYFFSPWGASVVSAQANEDMERHPDTLCGSLAHFVPALNASEPPELLYINGRALVDPVPFRVHKLKSLQPNLVFDMLPTHVTPRQKRRAPEGKPEYLECLTGMGATPAPPELLPSLWRRRQHFFSAAMGFMEPLLQCSNPGEPLPELPPPTVKPKRAPKAKPSRASF